MRAGLAALTTEYTALAEDLASHGYIVVGFDAPYRTLVTVLPDGRSVERVRQNDADRLGGPAQEQLATRLVQAWSADTSFALDRLRELNITDPSGRFTGRLDLAHVWVFGHSLGGATALQFGHDDPRCAAGIDIDGAPLRKVVDEGVGKPFMFLLSDHTHEPEHETRAVRTHIEAIYNKLPTDARREMVIPGATHFQFGDAAITRSPSLMRVLRFIGIVGLDGSQQIQITRRGIRSFLIPT